MISPRLVIAIFRCVLVVIGGYVCTAVTVSLLGGAFAAMGLAPSEAVTLASLLGFVMYLLVLIAGFSSRPFRRAMHQLHSVAGVALAGVLFAMFWMGTLSVFDREIDRWMKPETRLEAPEAVNLNALATGVQSLLPGGATNWRLFLPDAREPVARLRVSTANGDVWVRELHGGSGEPLPDSGTLGATGFFFPFHFRLNLSWQGVGYWLAGFSGMMFAALLLSGIVVHRRLVLELFTFRPQKSLQRSSLDMHNLSGVMLLPFHLVVSLSGVAILSSIYWPNAHVGAYSLDQKALYQAESAGRFRRASVGVPGSLGDLEAMRDAARGLWGGDDPYMIRVWHPGDAASYVEFRRTHAHTVRMTLDQLYFDAASGELLHEFHAAPVKRFHRVLTGLHFLQFDNWPIRYLYFLGGLLGCVMIGSGFVIWLRARRRNQTPIWRLVEAITIASIPGLLLATLAFLCANKLLPPVSGWYAKVSRPDAEVGVFYLVWLLSLVHAAAVGGRAWVTQVAGVAVLALSACSLNASFSAAVGASRRGAASDAVIGVDLGLMLLALGAAWVLWRMHKSREID